MIRRVIAVMLFLFLLFQPVRVYASDSADTSDQITKLKQQTSSSLDDIIDDDIKQTLEQMDIAPDNTSGVNRISVSKILSSIYESFLSALVSPFKMLGRLTAICLFCTVISSVTQDSSLSSLYQRISLLVTVTVLYDSLSLAVQSLSSSLNDITLFMSGYIPLFSGVLASSANIGGAAGYYSSMFVLCEVITFVSTSLLLPLLSVVIALNIIGSIGLDINVSGICSQINSVVKWVLSALMMIFTGFVSLKGINSAATDTLASKTARFAASSFIPLVGGAVSEAYSAIYGSLGVIRSGVGVIGIAAVSVIALRPIIAVCALKLVLSLAAIINRLFGQERCAGFISGLNSVLSIGLGIIIAMSMIFVISTAVILLTSMHSI